MEITWKGTASIILSSGGHRLLFDPFVPLKGSPVPATIEDFDGYDDVLITHGHVDHIHSLPEIVRRNPRMKLHCTQTPWQVLRKKGVDPANLVLISVDQTLQLGPFRVQTFHGKHAVLPKVTWKRLHDAFTHPARRNLWLLLRENAICRENQETLFYHITAEGVTVSLMGSMNLLDGVTYPTGSDALILPYNGWEDNLPPAIRCIEALKPHRVLLDHYDDAFPPLTTPLDLAPILTRYPTLVQPLAYSHPITLEAGRS